MNEDRSVAHVEISQELDAHGVEALILRLGEIRANMTPKVLPRFGLGQPVKAVPEPAWEVEQDGLYSIIHLRDPRFGWVHYALPMGRAEQLGSALTEISSNGLLLSSGAKN